MATFLLCNPIDLQELPEYYQVHIYDLNGSSPMTAAQKIAVRLSQVRERLNEIGQLEGDAYAEEIRSEESTLQTEYGDLERRHRSALIAEGEGETRPADPDAEQRERVELRSKASLTAYLRAALAGRRVDGAEAELQSAAGIGEGIPIELWDVPQGEAETRADAPTGAPGTVGLNLDRLRPAVFSNSIAPRLGIEMPRVSSGSYASGTISTSLAAGSKAKGDAAEATAAAFRVNTVTPKRISARLGIRIEDVAAVGQGNFESVLRENLALVLSDELDDQAINGAGGNSGADLNGILQALTDPSDPTAVADFNAFASAHAGGVDGLWAATIKDVGIVVGPDTYRLASRTFQTATSYQGELSASAYALLNSGGFWTNKRMPAAASDIQQAILYRKGRSMMGGAGAMRTAVCPHWNEVAIDDIYSGSAQGERFFSMHVLLGDVILVQPGAYAQVAFKLA